MRKLKNALRVIAVSAVAFILISNYFGALVIGFGIGFGIGFFVTDYLLNFVRKQHD